MSRIIDLTDREGTHEILTTNSLDGLFGGGQILGGSPLETYLDESEKPQFVVRNKKAGLEIVGEDGRRTVKPADNYQTLAVVTDLRILVVAGKSIEDETAELQLTEIVEARSNQGRFRKSTVEITTLADETWKFPCKGDTSAVASRIDEMAQVWANAGRLLDEVEDQATAAQEHLDNSAYGAAHEELAGAESKIRTATNRIREVGPGAVAEVQQRANSIQVWVTDLQREIYAVQGASAHARAQETWEAESYERAATCYDDAVEAYEQALEMEGENPDEETLTERTRAAVREREILRVGPLVDADTARRQAAEIDDPEKAALRWESALDGYREMLGLDWGSDESTFVVNSETIREQTIAIADDAIDDHHEAGRQWLESGDKLAVQGRKDQAHEVYKRAETQFEQAHRLAREVRPEHEHSLESALETVEDRLSGTVPDEIPEEEPLSASVISGLAEEEPPAVDGEESPPAEREEPAPGAESRGSDEASRTAEPEPARQQPSQETGSAANASETAQAGATNKTQSAPPNSTDESEETSVIGRIRSQKAGTSTPGVSGTETSSNAGPVGDGSSGEAANGQGSTDSGQSGETQPTTGREPADAGVGSETDDSDDQLEELLRGLGEDEFTDLVAELWEAQGWSTTVFSATAKAVYDIVAMREEPEEERLLVWTVQRPDGGEVGGTVVKRCATAREGSQGADSATLVTTGSVTSAAEARAEEFDVDVVDDEELVNLLRFEELVDSLRSAAGR